MVTKTIADGAIGAVIKDGARSVGVGQVAVTMILRRVESKSGGLSFGRVSSGSGASGCRSRKCITT